MGCRTRTALVVLWFALACWAVPGGSAAGPSRSSVSIFVEPSSYVQGIYFFRVRISGYAVPAREGAYKGSEEVLFVYPVQARPCARDVYAETALQSDGQGYQYRVGPGRFSIEVTNFAGSRISLGHVCAYLAPLNFDVEVFGGVPLGPLSAKADLKIDVRAAV